MSNTNKPVSDRSDLRTARDFLIGNLVAAAVFVIVALIIRAVMP